MASPSTIERPLLDDDASSKEDRWQVTAFNNDVNTYLEVIVVLMLATGCTESQAYNAAWDIDHYGQAVVYTSSEQDCRRAGEIISSIGVRVEVNPEP